MRQSQRFRMAAYWWDMLYLGSASTFRVGGLLRMGAGRSLSLCSHPPFFVGVPLSILMQIHTASSSLMLHQSGLSHIGQ